MQARTKESRKPLSPEEQYQRSVRLKQKFKACIRLIMANVTWLQELEDENLGDNVKKNIAVLTRKKEKKSLFTLADKGLLQQSPEVRTPEQLERLRSIFGKMRCFKRFPAEVLDVLPSIAYFQYWPANRILLKQGYEPMNLYVIISGEILVTQSYYNNLLKQDVTEEVMIMSGGSIFGEVALIYDIPRAGTVTTLQNSEFLYFKRDDFDRYLKKTMLNIYEDLLTNIKTFNYFDSWTPSDLRECCILSRKKLYKEEEILLGCGVGYPDLVYFITKGRCFILEYMLIRTETKNGKTSYHLEKFNEKIHRQTKHNIIKGIRGLFQTPDGEETGQNHSLRPRLNLRLNSTQISTSNGFARLFILKIAAYTKMASFNYGENMKNRIIVADTDVECVILPRYFLMNKSRLTFKSVEAYLDRNIPTTRQVFESFKAEKAWERYRAELVKDTLENRRICDSKNTIHNVPYTIRIGADMGEIF